jgi:hypothetical protein
VTKIAGGAVDQYSSFTVGVAYIFDGVPIGARPAADEEPAAEAPPPEKKAKKKKPVKKSDDEDEEDGEDSED